MAALIVSSLRQAKGGHNGLLPRETVCLPPCLALEKEMAAHSSILALEIPWTEEPGGLQSRGSQSVGHN